MPTSTVPVPVPDISMSLALSLINASVAPVLLLDGELEVVAASQSFLEDFDIDPNAIRVAGWRIWAPANGMCRSCGLC